jgi:hypothetical protein
MKTINNKQYASISHEEIRSFSPTWRQQLEALKAQVIANLNAEARVFGLQDELIIIKIGDNKFAVEVDNDNLPARLVPITEL